MGLLRLDMLTAKASPDSRSFLCLAGKVLPGSRVRLRLPAHVSRAMVRSSAEPVYRQLARLYKVEGAVELEVLIGADGSVRRIWPLSGHAMLVASAVEAVSQWTFEPADCNGDPVEVMTTVTLEFSLGKTPAQAPAARPVSPVNEFPRLMEAKL
jgi:TonB family protein